MDLLGSLESHSCSVDMVVGDKEEFFLMRLHPTTSYTPSLSDFPATANSLPRDLSRTFFRHVIPHLQSTTFMGKGLNRGILLYSFTFYLVNRSAPDVGSLYRPDRSITSFPDLSVPKRVFTQ